MNWIQLSFISFQLEALMMNDIANHVLKALQKLEATGDIEKPNNNLCESKDNPWPYGGMLQNKILNVRQKLK